MSALQEPRHENVPNTVKGVWSDFFGEPLGSLWEALGTSGGSWESKLLWGGSWEALGRLWRAKMGPR